MNPFRKKLPATALIATFVIASAALVHPALAHPGPHVEAPSLLLAGLLHPLTGLDHLLAFIGMGFLAATHGTRPARALLAAFIAAFVAGLAIASLLPVGLASVAEVMSHATIIIVGLALLFGRSDAAQKSIIAPLAVAASVSAGGHGYLFGIEAPEAGSTIASLGGMCIASLALGFGGYALGRLVSARLPSLPRPVGAAFALAGAALGFEAFSN